MAGYRLMVQTMAMPQIAHFKQYVCALCSHWQSLTRSRRRTDNGQEVQWKMMNTTHTKQPPSWVHSGRGGVMTGVSNLIKDGQLWNYGGNAVTMLNPSNNSHKIISLMFQTRGYSHVPLWRQFSIWIFVWVSNLNSSYVHHLCLT